jgi:phytoene desaturase
MDNKKAVIIGSGVGGIATSILIAKKGFSVKVFEKNECPGGRCGQIIKDGHRFDIGATIFLMPGIYKSVFKSMGLNDDIFDKANPLPTIYKIYYPDGKIFDFTTIRDKMEIQMETFEKGSSQRLSDYTKKGYYLFTLAMEKLLGKNFYNWFQFINLSNIGLLFRMKTHVKHQNYVKRFFRDSHLKLAFTFQNIYVGQNPLKAPALFAMLPAAELSEGSLFPKGGMYGVVETLITEAKKLGVEFIYNKPVKEISVKGQKTEGVIFEDGNYEYADLVIANADLPYVYKDLLKDRKMTALLETKKYSCSGIVYHWGLDKHYDNLGHHCVFVSEDFKESMTEIFDKNMVGKTPSFYVHAPVNTDPTAAPSGEDTISVIVPTGHICSKNSQDWEVMKNNSRKYVINRLKEQGLTDIEDHIKFEICHTPVDWQGRVNVAKGSVFGSINHNIFQMGYFRPHNKHSKIKNLYFVGGSTHPGNGVPLVLLSSKLTTERIFKDNNIKD